jgi:uncharacterized protein (TIGR02996 family)
MHMESAFLQAIHERPGEPTDWLILADWLEESGQPDRAELLRVRQKLLGLDEPPAEYRGEPELAERLKLEDRLRGLLAAGTLPTVPEVCNSLGMRLALIPPGRFLMGSPDAEPSRYADEGPRHEVILTGGFYLGVFPVTQEEYQRVVGDNPSRFRRVRGLRTTKRLPVEMISWVDAMAFCRRLSDSPEERKAGRSYTLPTEAQWEYACRGGTTSAFSTGPTLTPEQANIRGVASEEKRLADGPTPVGRYPPNPFGLFDMNGNVWEWCLDFYSAAYYKRSGRTDPPGPRRGTTRVLRGGDWSSPAGLARSADRGHNDPEARYDYNGFRVVMIPDSGVGRDEDRG